jgi:hypothetical protein
MTPCPCLRELGIILPSDDVEIRDGKAHPDTIPNLYWNAAGAVYAYVFCGLANQGIDVIGESQLVGYPSQFPKVSMIDWKNSTSQRTFLRAELVERQLPCRRSAGRDHTHFQ